MCNYLYLKDLKCSFCSSANLNESLIFEIVFNFSFSSLRVFNKSKTFSGYTVAIVLKQPSLRHHDHIFIKFV